MQIFTLCNLVFLLVNPVSAIQFSQLVKEGHRDLADITFIYEGDSRFVGDPSLLPEPDSSVTETFQGVYQYRNDGATLIDLYTRHEPDSTLVRKIDALLSGKFERSVMRADSKTTKLDSTVSSGATGSLDMPCSPERMFEIPFWTFRLDSVLNSYQFIGWEDIQNESCLHIRIDAFNGASRMNGIIRDYWISPAKGWSVVQCEWKRGGVVTMRNSQIELRQVISNDNKPLWIPVRCVCESFLWEGKILSTPTFRETYRVVNGSIVINQGLKDSDFSTVARYRKSVPNQLVQVQAEFEKTPHFRTDNAGIGENLEKKLAYADAQRASLEASSPSRESGLIGSILQWGGITVGFGFLAIAGLYKLKSYRAQI